MAESQSSVCETKPWDDPSAKPYVRIKIISKKFGEFVAVDNVSLDIYQRELFCLLGGSGCGKSTLLRMLAGFEQPTSGSIEIDGQDMAGLPPHQRRVNMMFQSYALFPHMTVEKNIAYGLKRDGVGKAEIQDRVAEILQLVQLEQFAKRKPHQLSGGQCQRVALARSLIKRPNLLLLDEPLGALDKKLREETQFELMKIQEDLGVTFVVVTHDQEEAMTLSSRIGVMENGEIVQVDEPFNIYERPNSRFVADFIGSINLFEGRVSNDEEDHVIIKCDETRGEIYVGHGVTCTPNQKLWFALRPEKISLTRAKPQSNRNVAAGVVEEVAYMGNLSIYRVMLESGKRIKVTKPNLDRHEEDVFRWDEAVYATWGDTSGIVLLT